jgi:hypothetical protein
MVTGSFTGCCFVGLVCNESAPGNNALCSCGGTNARQFGFESIKASSIVDGIVLSNGTAVEFLRRCAGIPS